MQRVSTIFISSLIINRPRCITGFSNKLMISSMNNRRFLSAMPDFDFDDYRSTDYYEMTIRNTKMVANLLAKHDPPCGYCGGAGYVDCESCQHGCWRCQNSKIQEYPFCNGDGRGRPAYVSVPSKK